MSCASPNNHENGIYRAAQLGDINAIKSEVEDDPSLLQDFSLYDRNSLLHVAAANGQIEVGF